MKTTVLNSLLSLAAVCPLLAAPQEPGDHPDLSDQLVATSSVFSGFGTTRTQDQLLGAGPGYEAEFFDDGISFRPALGRDAEVMPLRLRLASVARRDAAAQGFSTDRAAPLDDPDQVTVRYPRSGYVETYEMRKDGVKQSFVFSALPPGAGDLVVRLAVETRLPVAHAAADEIRLTRDGIGGVRIGEVIGIDARGERIRGSLALRGDELELSLPAAFVNRAALPLVLDPIVSTAFGLGNASQDDMMPDIAYDASTDVFLVVWTRDFGWGVNSIMGQRILQSGWLVGAPVTIRSSGLMAWWPKVANVNATNRFGVVWLEEPGDIRAASVPAGGGNIHNGYYVTRNRRVSYPCIGGDGGTIEDDAIVAWTDWNASQVRAVQLQLPASGAPSLVGQLPSWRTRAVTKTPAISKASDSSGRHLLVWNDTDGSFKAVVVDRNLNTLAINTNLVQANLPQASQLRNPAVDGDGTHFVLAWDQGHYYLPVSYDVYAGAVRYDPAAGTVTMPSGSIAVENEINDLEQNPSVAWMGDSALVAYEDLNGSDLDTHIRSIDPFGCGSCEGEFLLDGSSRHNRFTAIASNYFSRSGSGDLALIVWQSQATNGGDVDLHGRWFRADDGVANSLTGAYGPGGQAYATCANHKNADFRLRLRGAAPNSRAYVVFSSTFTPVQLCSQNTYLYGQARVRKDTDSTGSAELPVTINDPALLGVVFYTQWWVLQPPSGCWFPLSHSNALQVTVQ